MGPLTSQVMYNGVSCGGVRVRLECLGNRPTRGKNRTEEFLTTYGHSLDIDYPYLFLWLQALFAMPKWGLTLVTCINVMLSSAVVGTKQFESHTCS